MGSILRLPNVGAEPRLLWSFTDRGNADRGDRGTAAVADWGANLAKTLEGFWPDAHVTRAERRSEGWALSYAAPTAIFKKDQPLTERTVVSQWLGAELWQDENQFYSVEWIQQKDCGCPRVVFEGIPFLFLASLSRILRKTGQFYTGNEPMHYSGFCSTFWTPQAGPDTGGAGGTVTLPPLRRVEVHQCEKGTVPEPSGSCSKSTSPKLMTFYQYRAQSGQMPKGRLWEARRRRGG
eukprot:g30015.t1